MNAPPPRPNMRRPRPPRAPAGQPDSWWRLFEPLLPMSHLLWTVPSGGLLRTYAKLMLGPWRIPYIGEHKGVGAGGVASSKQGGRGWWGPG